jgi:hypothetical protein
MIVSSFLLYLVLCFFLSIFLLGSNNYSTLPYMTSVEKLSDGDEKETRRNSSLSLSDLQNLPPGMHTNDTKDIFFFIRSAFH